MLAAMKACNILSQTTAKNIPNFAPVNYLLTLCTMYAILLFFLLVRIINKCYNIVNIPCMLHILTI